jgi:nicotinamidase-related amidase
MNFALVLIDIQNDYFPGGKMELEGSIEAGSQAGRLLDHFRKSGQPIAHIQHLSRGPSAKFFNPDTEGVKIHETVIPWTGEKIFQKHYPNAFMDTGLMEYLKAEGVKRLVLAGMMTHMCVDATVRAAFDLGFSCRIAGDACATKTLKFQGQTIPAGQVHGAFLAALDGVYGKALSVDELIAQVK